MSINLENYPRLIAAPFKISLEGDLQQKEYQRITLEMILSLNASACLSEYYAMKRSGKGEKLTPLDLDLGQMSIGKWNAFNRDVSKALKAETKNPFVTEIYELYHGSKKGKWTSAVDELIKRRNKDAHGEVISAERLPDELQERQEMINRLMELLSFYAGYRLMVPYDDEVKEGKVVYLCRDFSGIEEKILTVEGISEELEAYRPYLFNMKSRGVLPLSPMIVSHPLTDESRVLKTFVYSKTLNKKTGNLHYSGWESSKDFESGIKTASGDFFSSEQICREFEAFRVYVEDSALVHQKQPSINVERTFESSTIGVGETVVLSVAVKNEGDADAVDLVGVLNFPQEGFVIVDEEDNEAVQEPVKIQVPLIGQGDVWEQRYHFRSKDSGQYEFDPFTLSYSYVNIRNETVLPDSQNGINVETSSALLYSIFDPNDPESQMPIININMSYDNETPQIGDRVVLNIDVKNIGRSVANDVEISILPPKEQIELLSGSPDWTGTINPDQSVKSQFILLPRTHGVFSMKMRDIIYRNQAGDLFKTLAYEDYKILVRNNPKVRYRFLMEETWQDLSLDAEEEEQVRLFARQYEIDPEEKKNIESEVKIKIVKKLIKDIAGRADMKIREVARDGMYGFCLGPCPFLVVDFSDMDDIGLLVKGKFKGPQFEAVRASWRGRFREVNFFMFRLSALGAMGGGNRLKGMVNQALRSVDQTDYLLSSLADDISDLLSIKRESIDTSVEGRFIGYNLNADTAKRLLVNGFCAYFDQKGVAHLIGSYPQSSGIGKLLRDKGFQFARKNDFDADDPFEMVDRVTTFVHIGNQKINKNDKSKLFENIQEFVLNCNDLATEVVIQQFREDEQLKKCIETIHNTVSSDFPHFVGMANLPEKTLTYHLGRDFPIFEPGSAFVRLSIKRGGKIIVGLRVLEETIYEQLGDAVKVEKGYWHYSIQITDQNMALLAPAFHFAGKFAEEGRRIQDLSPSILKTILEQAWVSNFELVLREVSEKKTITFQDVDTLLAENNVKSKISFFARGMNRSFGTQEIECPIEIDSAEESLSLKEKYAEVVSDALGA
jgi:hypothetical protein